MDNIHAAIEQCNATHTGPQHVVAMFPRSRQSLVISMGWAAEGAWAKVEKSGTKTGESLPVTVDVDIHTATVC